jgi:N-methylhydantoinase B
MMVVDGYEAPVTFEVEVTISDTGIHVDFTGTSSASKYGINVPLAYTTAYTVFALGCVVAANIPNNSGSLAPLIVTAPKGCILNAQKPMPVATRHVLGMMLPDVVFGALRQTIPQRVPAEGASCVWLLTLRGKDREATGNYGFSISATNNGGTGARFDKDGLSATAYPSGVQGTPVEITEAQTPLIFWRKELLPDSGGAGRTRGGLGQIIEVQSGIGEPFQILAAFDRIDHPARGRDDGKDGQVGYLGLKSGKKLKGKGFQTIPPDERLVVHTPGGAGIGDARLRDRSRVDRDVKDGLVSRENAATLYGHAISAN